MEFGSAVGRVFIAIVFVIAAIYMILSTLMTVLVYTGGVVAAQIVDLVNAQNLTSVQSQLDIVTGASTTTLQALTTILGLLSPMLLLALIGSIAFLGYAVYKRFNPA